MRNTFFKLWVHGIIYTNPETTPIAHSLESMLHLEIEKRFMEQGCEIAAIGGTQEHIHFLFAQNPLLSIHDTLTFIQGITQRWYQLKDFNTSFLKFEWKNGYSAYSVSESNFEKTVRFIQNQKEFHQKYSLLEESEQLIKWHKVDISDVEFDSEIKNWKSRFSFQHLSKNDF